MVSVATVTRLLSDYVTSPGEDVREVERRGEDLLAITGQRRFLVRSERREWRVGAAEWVRDLVVATREDLHVHGQPERFAFLVVETRIGLGAPIDPGSAEELGHVVYLNDESAFAQLGSTVPADLDPVAYAELLVEFHPYSSARRDLLLEPDSLRTMFGLPDLPDVVPFRIAKDSSGTVVTFASCARYRIPGRLPQLDVWNWTLRTRPDRPATWSNEITDAGLALHPIS